MFKFFNTDTFCADIANDTRFLDVINCTDVDEAWVTWFSAFTDISNKHAPIKEVRVKDRNNPWMSTDIIKMMYERDYIHQQACKSKDHGLFQKYKALRNKVTNCITKAKRDYYENEINSNKNDSRKTWKTLRSCIQSSDKSNKCDLSAQELNDHFLNVGKILSSKFGDDYNFTWNLPESIHEFKFYELTSDFVSKSLCKLPNKCNDDVLGLNSILLKESEVFITDSLTHVFNLSLCNMRIPADWKKARVAPIYKGSGKHNDGNNFRPISVISYIAKILERGIQIQFVKYLTDNNFITMDQSAYVKNHSTLTALLRVIDDWYEAMENDEIVAVGFLDLSKCFDSIDHSLLLFKLTKYGIHGAELGWFRDYLSGRSQCVCSNGEISDFNSISLGVPQGSILGPILFLLYINDLPSAIKKCSVNLFADDTMFYASSSDPASAMLDLQEDINNSADWFRINRLSINTKKSCVQQIKSRYNQAQFDEIPDISMDGLTLETKGNIKYLGVHIDNQLNWSTHVDETYKKIAPKMHLLRRLSRILPFESLNCLYNSIIKPHFDYCLAVWGNCSQSDIIKLQRLQNRIARIVSNNFDFNTPSITIVKDLKWFNICELRDFQINCLMYKSLNNRCPHYLSDKFNLCKDVNVYSTRSCSSNKLCVPTFNKEHCKSQAFSVKGPNLFNDVPNGVKDAPSYGSFKSRYKKHFM